MDRKQNPFAPGAGTRPPELAGRDLILEDAGVALARVKAARPAKGQMLLGLRGVGKTVLLNEIAGTATFTVRLSAPAQGSDVTFDITTQDGSARTADHDYVAKSLTNHWRP